MKRVLLLITLNVIISGAFAQLTAQKTQKICLDQDISNVGNIAVKNDILVCKINLGQELVGYDLKSEKIVWTKKYPKQYYVGYGIYQFGDYLMFANSTTTYDAKGKPSYACRIFLIDEKTGEKKDSVKWNFDVMYLSDSPGKSGLVGAIRQNTNSLFTASLITQKTGVVKYDLITEDSKTGSMPNCISTDANEKWIAVGTANGSGGFILYHFETGKQAVSFPGKGDIHNCVFSSDGKFVFFIQNKKLTVFNTSTLKTEKQIAVADNLSFVAVNKDDENLALTGFGNGAAVTFINWKTEKSTVSTINTTGMNCYFTNDGDFIAHSLKNALSCKLDKEAKPYLVRFLMNQKSTSVDNSVNSESSAINEFSQGDRAFIRYAGDKKFYSGTITEISGTVYKVFYDDGSVSSVKKEDLKALPLLSTGLKVQCRASDKKYYWGTISEIKGNAVFIKFSDNKTSGWFPVSEIMMVE